MFRLDLDHRVEQSRIIANMMSLNGYLWHEFTSFCIAYRLRTTNPKLKFSCCIIPRDACGRCRMCQFAKWSKHF